MLLNSFTSTFNFIKNEDETLWLHQNPRIFSVHVNVLVVWFVFLNLKMIIKSCHPFNMDVLVPCDHFHLKARNVPDRIRFTHELWLNSPNPVSGTL